MEPKAIEPDLSHLAEQPMSTNPKQDSESSNQVDLADSNAIAEANSLISSVANSKLSNQAEPGSSMKFTPKRPSMFLWLRISKDNETESPRGHCFYLADYDNNHQDQSVAAPHNGELPQMSPEIPKRTLLHNLTRYLIKLINNHSVSHDECLLNNEEFTLLKSFLIRKFLKQANDL